MHTKVWWEIAEIEQPLNSDYWELVENENVTSWLEITLSNI